MNQKSELKHIALVLDGNRRWAKERKVPLMKALRTTIKKVSDELVDLCMDEDVQFLTLWAFSTENWKRGPEEVNTLMMFFREMLDEKIDELHERGIRINTIGDLSRFAQDIQDKVKDAIEKTKHNEGLTLTFALNYGGRDELVRAVKKIVGAGKKVSEITKELISQNVDTADMPDPDLIIRPSGETRLSGFMLWQSEYSEFYFPETLMPDFGGVELKKAIEDFRGRSRRRGA